MPKGSVALSAVKRGFTHLTKREQVMIYGLVIIVVLAVLIFLVALPALTHLAELSEEAEKYKTEETEMRLAISQTDTFTQQAEEATEKFNGLKKRLLLPMDPESLDEMITAMVIKSGLSPKDLKMTKLQQGLIPPYEMQPLASVDISDVSSGSENSTGGAVETTDEGDSTATAGGSSGAATGGATDSAAPGDNTASGAAINPNMAYVYTVSVTAEGDKTELSNLINAVNKTSGIELNSYKYGLTSKDATSETVTMGGNIDLKFYVYVYADITSGVTYEPIGTGTDEEETE